MLTILVILSVIYTSTLSFTIELSAPRLHGRIINGEDTQIELTPYQLSLQNNNGHICGASIISENWALTAAHCVTNFHLSKISLRAGSSWLGSGGTLHQASHIITHPSFNSTTKDYDYAVIKVSMPFSLGQRGVDAILLADFEPLNGVMATVSGWGRRSNNGSLSRQLQRVDVPIIEHSLCQDKYRGVNITTNMICAGLPDKDSCNGDSGGPLVYDGRLVGIVSAGVTCGSANYPGVYANVVAQRVWIKQHTGV